MCKIKIFFIFVLFVFSTINVFASDFTVHKLANGQTLIIKEIHDNPIVTIDTWINTGSINENDTNNGISHFLEHLFFKGTKQHPVGEMDKILESKGAVVNAATSKDFTHYYITIPSEYLDTALELHADMLLNPQIPRKELEKERMVVLEEISKDENTPSKKVYENLNDLMYTTHPYKRKVIGSAENVSTMSREEILDYFNKYYAPSNMTTIVVGNVDTTKVVNKIQNLFNQSSAKIQRTSYKKEKQITSQRRKTEYIDAQSGYIMIGFRGVNIASNDTFALDVLSEIMGGGKSSRLIRDIKEQKGLAYSISSSNLSMKDDGIFYITANFIPQNGEKLEKQIFNCIENIKKYGVTEEELNTAKNKIIQETYYSRESTAGIASELGYIYSLTGASDLYTNYVNEIRKVDSKAVQNAAKKYLSINNSAISIVLPESYLNKSEIVESACGAKKISSSNGIDKFKLDNGATVLVNENDNNDIVAITIIAKGGEFIETIPGEGTLAAETLLKGTKKYSASELAQILDDGGIKIDANCEEDFFVIDIQTTTSQLTKTLEIIDEIINNAAFDDYELEKERAKILSKIKQKRDVPMNIALENFKTLIYENSVYSHSNKVIEKTLPSISRDNVIKYYNNILDSKNIIVSINGKVSSENITKEFAKILKDKKCKKFNINEYTVTKLNSSKFASKQIKNIQTAWLFLGWQTAGVADKKDFVTLKVINTLLGSGLSSRLYKNIRESDGLAYQLGSVYTPKMLGGIFMTYIGTNPNTLEISKSKMLNEINRLKLEFVSDTELQDAKDRLKGGFILALETNSEKSTNIGFFEAYGFGYDFLNEYVNMVDSITASDIIKVANKYFTSNLVQSEVR